MKAKLIKTPIGIYRLMVENSDYDYGHTSPEYCELQNRDGSYSHKLSLKNCQAIERGYDLEQEISRLVDKKAEQNNTIDLDAYAKGLLDAFQKALEILGDKKFSEEDLRLAMHFGQFGEANNQTTTIGFIQSLQQTEWDVEIVMEDTFVSNQGLGYNEFVTCRVLKIEGNNVYGEYIKGTKTNLDVPFSLSALNDIEGNSIGEPKLDADGCLILRKK